MDNFTPGLIPDPRTEEAKKRDFPHAELYGISLPKWEIKDQKLWSKYTIRNQKRRSSCVGEAIAKAFEMEFGEPFNSCVIYSHRANTGLGMWLQNGGEISVKVGTVPRRVLNDENTTEAECNTPIDISKYSSDIKKAKAYIFVNAKNIDEMAVALDNGHALIMTFESNYKEWDEVPNVSKDPIQWGHCVCDPKDRTLWTDANYKNAKALVVDESWGVGINADHILEVDGKRLITEDFIKARCTGCMYLIFDKTTEEVKPKYNFSSPMVYGMKNNLNVKMLQKCLAYDGEFVKDEKFFTGNYFEMTAKAVMNFQTKYNIATSDEIKAIGGKNVGPKTRAKLNSLFN